MTDSHTLFGGLFDDTLDLEEFVALCADPLGTSTTPTADSIDHGIPIYDGDRLRSVRSKDSSTCTAADAIAAEFADVLGNGSGVVVVRRMWPDRPVVDAMTDVLLQIVERERSDADGFDHFAEAGANSRAWDVLGKSAKLAPGTFVDYYANPLLDLVSRAWLGPLYQLTAQVNIVHPGGAAQSPHRDYHLGFVSDAVARRFPRHAHRLSQSLTLQGGVAHTPMPVEAGPTRVLPGSQRFAAGYLAWRDPRFAAHFEDHAVQLAMEPGDALFFNPGLHHGAGENRLADHDRIANLLQVSSAFGVPMEAVDWTGIAVATYPHLLDLSRAGQLTDTHLAVCASGYAFPSNLDTDTSDQGLAPASLQQVVRDALHAEVTPPEFARLAASKEAARRPA